MEIRYFGVIWVYSRERMVAVVELSALSKWRASVGRGEKWMCIRQGIPWDCYDRRCQAFLGKIKQPFSLAGENSVKISL